MVYLSKLFAKAHFFLLGTGCRACSPSLLDWRLLTGLGEVLQRMGSWGRGLAVIGGGNHLAFFLSPLASLLKVGIGLLTCFTPLCLSQ